jgi:putative ABC transport system ATP-binding protein
MNSLIELQGVSKSFSQGDKTIQVLKNISLQIQPGETLAVVGPSGSGKSTLLSLIAGLDAPDSGDVKVLNQSLLKMTEKELSIFRRENFGIVFQQFYLFSYLSALENVALPLELIGDANAQSKAREALEKVGLSHRLGHMPHQLSGGENQRVAIARAFVTNPKVLLADEPSGSLDQVSGDSVMNLIFELVEKNKMALVLITHNDELAKRCQKSFDFKRANS